MFQSQMSFHTTLIFASKIANWTLMVYRSNFFLVMLNAFYESAATGETFNKGGRTDILLKFKNNNILIVECKILGGKKILLDAIDQLFNYTTWYDTKWAIFIFNKESKRNFSTILKKVDLIMKKHNNFKTNYTFKNSNLHKETIFGYVFYHPEDTNKDIFLTVIAFNIPKSKKENKNPCN